MPGGSGSLLRGPISTVRQELVVTTDENPEAIVEALVRQLSLPVGLAVEIADAIAGGEFTRAQFLSRLDTVLGTDGGISTKVADLIFNVR